MPPDAESAVTERLTWYLDPGSNPIKTLTAGQRTVMAVLRSCYRGATTARVAADLRLPEHASAVASRMLSGPDLAARNWALTHLPVESLKEIRVRRGYDSGGIAVALDSTIRARETRRDHPGYVKPIGLSLSVSGMRVASLPLPDLFASKLDVIMHRSKLRDYIDIATLDSQSPYTIEDGIRFYIQRYGILPHSPAVDRILNLLEEPDALDNDHGFERQRDEVFSYLLDRVLAVRAYLATLRQAVVSPTKAMRQRGGRPDDT